MLALLLTYFCRHPHEELNTLYVLHNHIFTHFRQLLVVMTATLLNALQWQLAGIMAGMVLV